MALVTGSLALLITAFAQFSPASADPAQASANIAVSPSSAPQGATVTISGTVPVASCSQSDPTQLTSTGFLFPAGGFGPQAPRAADGSFSVTYQIPGSTPVGSYVLGINCGGNPVGISATLQVTATPVSAAIRVSPTAAQPGTNLVISGIVPPTGPVSCGVAQATQLLSNQALFPPNGVGPQVSRDTSGNFNTDYTVPSNAEPGIYTIGVLCAGNDVGITATLTVAQSAPTTTTVAPSTTTTTVVGSGTSNASPTTAPTVSTITTAPHDSPKKSKSHNLAIWLVVVAVLLVVGAGLAVILVGRRGARSGK